MKRKTVGMIQPNYLPWRGYFDFIAEVDVFVFLDDVQYTSRDWRNRNRIVLPSGGTSWVTVPVRRARRNSKIAEIHIDNSQDWATRHLSRIFHSYKGTPGFADFFPQLESGLLSAPGLLRDLNVSLTESICQRLGIATELFCASELVRSSGRNEGLISIVDSLGGTRYLTGPSALGYLNPNLWDAAGIELSVKDYSNYPAYKQIAEPFEPNVSIVDLIFMTGKSAPRYIPALAQKLTM